MPWRTSGPTWISSPISATRVRTSADATFWTSCWGGRESQMAQGASPPGCQGSARNQQRRCWGRGFRAGYNNKVTLSGRSGGMSDNLSRIGWQTEEDRAASLAMLPYELRTPLVPLSNYAQILCHQGIDQQIIEQVVGGIERQAR